MSDGRHVHQYNMEEAKGFNTSHKIHTLSFGEPYPGMRPNPLDGTGRIIDEGASVVFGSKNEARNQYSSVGNSALKLCHGSSLRIDYRASRHARGNESD